MASYLPPMNFLIISEVVHKKNGRQVAAYAPYVKEMNLWVRHFEKVSILAPVSFGAPENLDLAINHPAIELVAVPFADYRKLGSAIRSFLQMPGIVYKMFRQMQKADHIHLRCPASISLLACFVQLFFPRKKKTAKYAGNWDWECQQPFSYRLQQHILQNSFLTRHMQVLVYGSWPGATRNLLPFFTASYATNEIVPLPAKSLAGKQKIWLAYVGTFSPNKRPLLAVKTVAELQKHGLDASLHMFGSGDEMQVVKDYISQQQLGQVVLHGDQPPAVVKNFLQKAHFLLFASRSEGWPKVVAEAMFWACVPITTAVSCVPQMLGNNQRGRLVLPEVDAMVDAVLWYVQHPDLYLQTSKDAAAWSQQYTLEKLDEEISRLV